MYFRTSKQNYLVILKYFITFICYPRCLNIYYIYCLLLKCYIFISIFKLNKCILFMHLSYATYTCIQNIN